MKKILVLATCSENAKVILWCLREAGYYRIAAGNLSVNRELPVSPLCNKFYEIPESYSYENRSKEIIPMLTRIIRKEKIDAVIPSGFESLKFISQYTDDIKNETGVLTTPALGVIDMLNNKYKFALFCKNNNIPQPGFYLLKDISLLSNNKIGVRFPILVKPLSLSGGEGISHSDNFDMLRRDIAERIAKQPISDPLLLQEYIPGEDIDLNAFVINGIIKAWTIQRYIYIPQGTNRALKWYQFVKNDDVLELGKTILESARYSGPINIGFRIDARDSRLKAIEVNPRFWASTFYSLCDGVNFVDVGLRLVFDDKYAVAPKYTNRIWGTPHRIPLLVIKHKKLLFIKYGLKHSMLQIKYNILNLLFRYVMLSRKIKSRLWRRIVWMA